MLAVVVSENNSFAGDAIDIGRLIPHQAVTVGTDVGNPDVIAPDDENVRLLRHNL